MRRTILLVSIGGQVELSSVHRWGAWTPFSTNGVLKNNCLLKGLSPAKSRKTGIGKGGYEDSIVFRTLAMSLVPDGAQSREGQSANFF